MARIPHKNVPPPTCTRDERPLATVLSRAFEALDYALRGHTPEEVAVKFGMSSPEAAQSAITQAMDGAAFLEDATEERRRQYLKAERVIAAAWKAFDRSCEDEVTVTYRQTINKLDDLRDDAGNTIATRGAVVTLCDEKRRGQAGNPSLLRIILEAMERQANLRGLDQQQPNVNLNISAGAMSDEQLLRIAFQGSRRGRTLVGAELPALQSDGAGGAEAASSEVESAGIHEVHEAGLHGELAPPDHCGSAGSGGGGED